MKKIVILFILLLIFIPSVYSIRLYSTPNINFIFEPNLKKIITYSIGNNLQQTINVKLNAEGDLAEYITFDKDYVQDIGPQEGFSFTVRLNLPDKIEKPGLHEIWIKATEERPEQGGIGALGAVKNPIKIRVRYPDKYAEATLSGSNARVNGFSDFTVKVSNFGSKYIANAVASIDIFETETGTKLTTLTTDNNPVEIDQTVSLAAKLDTSNYKKGKYKAIAYVDYDGINLTTNEAYFMVGDISILITNHTQRVERDSIVPFDIYLQSEWNNKINNIYAITDITKNESIVKSLKTPLENIDPWEKKKITGYFETSGMQLGVYDLNILLFYEDTTAKRTGNIEVTEKMQVQKESPLGSNITVILLVVIIILLSLLNIMWFISLKIKEKRINNSEDKPKKSGE